MTPYAAFCRLSLDRCLELKPADAPSYYPRGLPAARSAMPALRELELLRVDQMSAAHKQELAAAPRPTSSGLTALSMSCDQRSSLACDPSHVVHAWLSWVTSAATQLRTLSLRGRQPTGGPFPALNLFVLSRRRNCIALLSAA